MLRYNTNIKSYKAKITRFTSQCYPLKVLLHHREIQVVSLLHCQEQVTKITLYMSTLNGTPHLHIQYHSAAFTAMFFFFSNTSHIDNLKKIVYLPRIGDRYIHSVFGLVFVVVRCLRPKQDYFLHSMTP